MKKRREDLDKEYKKFFKKDIEVWETETQFVIFGEPSKKHNCDFWGCPTVGGHILFRDNKKIN